MASAIEVPDDEIVRLNRESAKLEAETRKLLAEANKLSAEQSKLSAEQAKYVVGSSILPRSMIFQAMLATAALLGAGAAIAKLFFP
jgi:cell division protein FtsB